MFLWCEISKKIAWEICDNILSGSSPLEVVSDIASNFKDLSSTCLEDIGRQILGFPESEKCIGSMEKTLMSVDVTGVDRYVILILFSILFTYYRRLRIEDKMDRLLKKFKDYIDDTPIYVHAKAMWIEKSNIAPINNRLLLAIEYELEALRRDPDYIGAQHKLADLVVQALEENWELGECKEPDVGCIPIEIVSKLKNYLRKLAFENQYPRAYYTLARFSIVEGKYDEAVDLIGNAIRLEPPSTKDYNLRLSEYYNTLLLARSLKRIESNIDKITGSIKEDLKDIILRFNDQLRIHESRIFTIISVYIGMITIIFTFTSITSMSKLLFREALILEIIITMILLVLIIYLTQTFSKNIKPNRSQE